MAAVAASLCIACGLPSRTRAEAERTSAAIDAENGDIARKEAAYRTFVASSAYAPYRIYAERERWSGQFDYARAKTAEAKTTYEREVAPVAGRVERRGGFRDVLAHDRHVADLAVALAELVMGETDGA